MTEKYLEAYNDVFADIVNVLLFHGARRVLPEQLTDCAAPAVYKAQNTMHEEERDISKFWDQRGMHIAICGIENQTKIHPYMPFRIMGYDGASYREQLLQGARQKKYPVITIVLHFGSQRWKKPLKLSDCLDIEEDLQPYFSDYRINVFDIAFLPEEVIQRFTSDFRIVADYFSQVRKNRSYTPSRERIRHVNAVLKLMAVMTNDQRFLDVQRDTEKGEVQNMCEVLDRAIEQGRTEGHAAGLQEGHTTGLQEGRAEGLAQGRLLLADAIRRLNDGESAGELLQSGVDADTVELALTFKYPLP